MIIKEFEITINAPKDFVYAKAETYPTFVTEYDVKNILENTDTGILVEVGYKYFGIVFKWTGIGEKKKNEYIHYVQDKGLYKGMRANWDFYKVDAEKTLVKISIMFKKLTFIQRLLLDKIDNIVNGFLLDLKRICE